MWPVPPGSEGGSPAQTTASNLQTEFNRRRGALQKLQRKLQDLPDEDDAQTQIHGYESRILELEASAEIQHRVYQDLVRQMAAIDETKAPHQQAIEEASRALDEIKAAAERANADMERAANEAAKAESAMRRADAERQGAQQKLADAARRLQQMANELQAVLQAATEKHPTRVPFSDSFQTVEAKLLQLERRLREQQKAQGKLEDVVRELEERSAKYKEIQEDYRAVLDVKNELASAIIKRANLMINLRAFLSVRSQAVFRSLLARRNYSGKLVFDHGTQELQIRVRAADKKKARATLQLSGGERSFSTISFLAAMWDSIENPFRALDEFDVFMDAVNRKTATKVIVENSEMNPTRQFIIITPLELTSEAIADNVNVIRLEAHK